MLVIYMIRRAVALSGGSFVFDKKLVFEQAFDTYR